MNVLFAPDWREGNPYQRLLAAALERKGVTVQFLAGYRRVLPLSRLLADRTFDVLHLHWPEAYAPCRRDGFDLFRRARFPLDLAYAVRSRTMVATAHNLYWHDRESEVGARAGARAVYRLAKAVFAHSEGAKRRLVDEFGLRSADIIVTPHGDLSADLGAPVARAGARRHLNLGDEKLALIFGTISPYKGIEPVIEWWRNNRPPAILAVVGQPRTAEYGDHFARQATAATNVLYRPNWLNNEALRLWLSAADLAVFNYAEIFTSGAACLARSYGLPILMPARHETIDLDEPTPRVRRFRGLDSDFGTELAATLDLEPDFASAADWRAATGWDRVADQTIAGYRQALGRAVPDRGPAMMQEESR